VKPLYFAEHLQAVIHSLDLANKKALHLRYSQTTLFAMRIDLAWVKDLGVQAVLAEKVEAFVSRFGRLQDHIGEKLLPSYAALMGESPKTLIDTLAFAERAEVLRDANAFIASRRLRNALIHEYMLDEQLFLDQLLQARDACSLFYDAMDRVSLEMQRLGLHI
jgi:hypothetical protein